MKCRPVVSLLMIFFLLLNFMPAAYPSELETEGTPMRKLQRGFLNVALSPVEFSNELSKVKKKEWLIPSWIYGLGTGAAFMTGRILVGTYEMLTFPLEHPEGYRPIIRPEFAWDYLPSLPEEDSKSKRRS